MLDMTNNFWLTSPLALYDEYYEKDKSSAVELFTQLVQNELLSASPKVPMLNEIAIDSIPDGHLVRVHGMVQDMFNSEFFMDQFDIPGSLTSTSVSLRFRDFGPNNMDLSDEPQNLKFSERQSFYLVPVPGESDWVRRIRANACQYSAPCSAGGKRSASAEVHVEAKKNKGMVDSDATASKKIRKQFPLIEEESDESKTGVLVRVYDNVKDSLKINEIVCIYGILEHTRLGPAIINDECVSDGKGSEPVPRVHAIVVQRMKHNNPLFLELPSTVTAFCGQMRLIRESMARLLVNCFNGDEVAAEFTLMHLISSRLSVNSPYPTTLPALNLICQPTGACNSSAKPSTSNGEPMEVQPEIEGTAGLFDCLRELLTQLVTQLATVNVTLDSLNKGPCLMPIRDTSKGLLDAGRLQVPDGTQILVDETGMTAGQLDARGLLNLRALTMLATRQRVPYDFQFYTQEWETNARVLIISNGHSLIKPVLSVPYQPIVKTEPTSAPVLTEQQWSDIRKYITFLSHSGGRFTLDNALQQHINDDFVRWRRDKATFIEAEDFAIMLCLLRLLCLSYGQEQATLEHWQTVCNLEQKRKDRIKAHTVQPAA